MISSDREAVTLGGLIHAKTSVSRSQVPAQGDIPLIGNAFKSRTDLTGKTELIIILTPRIVRNSVDAQLVTEEFADRLRFTRPRHRTSARPIQRTIMRVLE